MPGGGPSCIWHGCYYHLGSASAVYHFKPESPQAQLWSKSRKKVPPDHRRSYKLFQANLQNMTGEKNSTDENTSTPDRLASSSPSSRMQINQRRTSHFAAVTHLESAPTLVTGTAKRRGSQVEKPWHGTKGQIWEQIQAKTLDFKRGGWRIWDPTGRSFKLWEGQMGHSSVDKKEEGRYWHTWGRKEERRGEAAFVSKSQRNVEKRHLERWAETRKSRFGTVRLDRVRSTEEEGKKNNVRNETVWQG